MTATLNQFARNVTSQEGEDGIIERALDTLGIDQGWCVEFGAWDGKFLSNTWNLINNRRFSAILIEGDAGKCAQISQQFPDRDDVTPVNRFVGFGDDDKLDVILAETNIPIEFDFLSIDIDGNDYHVWDACEKYRPKLVCIEYNPTVPSEVEFVQEKITHLNQGSSIAALVQLGKRKGYELIAITELNGIFVDAKYFDLFQLTDNSVYKLRPSCRLVSHIFTGYDGTVFLHGNKVIQWFGVPFSESRLQQIPRSLRIMPGHFGSLQKFLFKLFKSCRKRRLI